MSDYDRNQTYQDRPADAPASSAPTATSEDASELRKQRAKEFYDQWQNGARNAAREYLLRQTPLELQSDMTELVDKDYPPTEDLEGKLWQIDEKGVHPTVLPPGTPLYVQRQVAAQIAQQVGMKGQIGAAEEMLANPDDAGVMYPPVTGTPTPHPTDESAIQAPIAPSAPVGEQPRV